MTISGAPWEHQGTALARAFDAAMARVEALALGAGTAHLDVTATDRDSEAMLVSGTGANATELGLYVEALALCYAAEATGEADDTAEAEAEQMQRVVLTTQLMRGLAVLSWLAGHLHGAESSAGSTLADRTMTTHEAVRVLAEGLVAGESHGIPLGDGRYATLIIEGPSAGSTLAVPEDLERPAPEADPLRWLGLILQLEVERATTLARAMEGHPIAELFDGVARELRELLDREDGQ